MTLWPCAHRRRTAWSSDWTSRSRFRSWFLRGRPAPRSTTLWQRAEREGETWLSDCAPPFWGRPGRPRPVLPEHLRRAERSLVGGRHLGQEHVPDRRSRRRGHRIHPGHAPPAPPPGGRVQHLALRPRLPLDRARDLPAAVHRARAQEQPGAACALPGPGSRRGSLPERSPPPWSDPKMRSMPRISALVMHEHLVDLAALPTNDRSRHPAGGRRVASS